MKNKTLIILDWDDTLFPTTWVNMNNIKLSKHDLNENNIEIFKKLDTLIIKLLKKIYKKGEIIIITNALLVWINTCFKILPKTKLFFDKYNIKIVSARENYRNQFRNPTKWKINSFNDVNSDKNINIISIGDSISEYKALIELYNNDIRSIDKYYKSVKFIHFCRYCDFSIINQQIIVLDSNLNEIINVKKNLDLEFRLKK